MKLDFARCRDDSPGAMRSNPGLREVGTGWFLVALVIFSVALNASDCGGTSRITATDDRSAIGEPSPTASHGGGVAATPRFFATAAAICSRLSRAITDPKGTVLNLKSLARLAPRHAALEKKAVKELSALTAPASVAADWLRILAYRRRLAEELAKLGHAARADDVAGINRLGAVKKRLYKDLSSLATHDGVSACAKAGKSPAATIVRPPLARHAKRS
jgi:hypothetical protein